jgi:hypothetical protein
MNDGVIWCLVIFAAVFAISACALWLEARSGARRNCHGDRSRHPAGRRLPAPGLERDGEPLTRDEWALLVGCLFASNQAIAEPTYRTPRG